MSDEPANTFLPPLRTVAAASLRPTRRPGPGATPPGGLVPGRREAWQLVCVLAGVLAVFSPWLAQLAAFALHDELHSYILLVPLVSGYLLWLRPVGVDGAWRRSPVLAASCFALGAVALALVWLLRRDGEPPAAVEDVLAPAMLACLLFSAGAAALVCGGRVLRAAATPLGFLLFAVPCPVVLRQLIEAGLQEGSVAVATTLFALSGTPVLREQLVLTLPGFSMEVAPQCSGIRSTVVLLLTACVAGIILLRSRRARLWLAAAVVPLALLRNGLRIFTVGELCVHVGPHMQRSYLHQHGGPLFFALSLVPFVAFVWWLRRADRSTTAADPVHRT